MITDINQLDFNKTYTYADYLTWRFEEMVELIKGKLFMMSPAPANRHQLISSRLLTEVLPRFKDKKCNAYHAPFDVRLVKKGTLDSEITTVVQPDFCVVCDATKLDERGCVGAPDWIIEILSPSTAKKDYNEKYNLYEENGVLEYWIANPDASCIHQYALGEDGKFFQKAFVTKKEKLQSVVFEDIIVDLGFVFQLPDIT